MMEHVHTIFDPSSPPPHPELHACRQSLSSVLDPAYWRKLCPKLHVAEKGIFDETQPLNLPTPLLRNWRDQVDTAGVAHAHARELSWSCSTEDLAEAVVLLLQYGWPASFLVLYDEVWLLIQQASDIMKEATGNVCNMDVLAWYVDPNRGDAGFSPHRDRQPDDSPATFRPDGSAVYSTCWIPFTHATPENSCLYVIPRYADPGYYEGDPEEEGAPAPLTRALHNKEAYQHIRALPAEPGSAIIFTHRIIHWGSKGRVGHPVPRISMSFGCADDGYEPPYFSREHLPCPPLALRLALAAAQMFIYHERFPMTPKQVSLFHEAFTSQAAAFDPSYRKKVMVEFVAASKEAAAGVASKQKAASTAAKVQIAGKGTRGDQELKQGQEVEEKQQKQPEQQQHKKKRKQQQESGHLGAAAGGVLVSQKEGKKVKKKQKVVGQTQPQQEVTAGESPEEQRKKKQKQKMGKQAHAVAAVAEASAAAVRSSAVAAAAENGDQGGDEEEDSDVLDLAMEAMLDAAMADDDLDFDDDFDGADDDDSLDGDRGLAGLRSDDEELLAAAAVAAADDESDDEEEPEYDEHGLAYEPRKLKQQQQGGIVAGTAAAAAGGAGNGRGENGVVQKRVEKKGKTPTGSKQAGLKAGGSEQKGELGKKAGKRAVAGSSNSKVAVNVKKGKVKG